MIFSFEKISLIKDNKYKYTNANSITSISKKDLNMVNNLYKEYTGNEFPSFKIYSIEDDVVIISIDSNIKTIKNDTLTNLSKILLYQNDKRITHFKNNINDLKNIITNGYFLFNYKD